jgi:Arc/MetJ family transcription regulator
MMRTNIVLDDELVEEAFKYAKDIHTKKDLIETALKEFVKNRKMKNLRDLKGKVLFAEGYDYKKMRAGK